MNESKDKELLSTKHQERESFNFEGRAVEKVVESSVETTSNDDNEEEEDSIYHLHF